VREGWLALLLVEEEQSSGLIPILSTLETEAAVESFAIVHGDGEQLFFIAAEHSVVMWME